MSQAVDLINQVQKILPVRYGGSGSESGYASERLIGAYMNDTGAAIARGTLVKLAGWSDPRVIPTTTANEQGALGVVVGRYRTSGEALGEFEDADPAHQETVAVCLIGRCPVLIESAVTVGQYAYAANTDGTAYSGSVIGVGAIGQFESTSAAGTAVVRLWGGPSTPGMFGALVAVLGDGVTTLQVNTMGDLEIPFNLTLTRVTMLSTQSGSCVIDIYVDTYANFPATDADSITGAAPPTITSGIKSQDTTLTGWTVNLNGGDTLRFNVESASGLSQVTVQLAFIRR